MQVTNHTDAEPTEELACLTSKPVLLCTAYSASKKAVSKINPCNVTTVAIQVTQAQGVTFSYFLVPEASQFLVQIIPGSLEYQYTHPIIWAEWLSRSQ